MPSHSFISFGSIGGGSNCRCEFSKHKVPLQPAQWGPVWASSFQVQPYSHVCVEWGAAFFAWTLPWRPHWAEIPSFQKVLGVLCVCLHDAGENMAHSLNALKSLMWSTVPCCFQQKLRLPCFDVLLSSPEQATLLCSSDQTLARSFHIQGYWTLFSLAS